jgi:putative endonuclease
MIKNSKNDLYVGITENPDTRVRTHNKNCGAWFTKNKPDFNLVFLEEYDTLIQARQREIQIKKWRREKKELLIERYKLGSDTKVKT